MAQYQIMYWKEFPAQVKAFDDEGHRTSAMLPDRFSEAIDSAAMAEGSTGTDAYLEGWGWGPVLGRPGTPDEVVAAVRAELDAAYPPARLQGMIRGRKSHV